MSARQIVDAVNNMNLMTQTVANATTEQKSGGGMVVRAMENITDLTRVNLSSVEQLAASAQDLSGQAVDLSTLVSSAPSRPDLQRPLQGMRRARGPAALSDVKGDGK